MPCGLAGPCVFSYAHMRIHALHMCGCYTVHCKYTSTALCVRPCVAVRIQVCTHVLHACGMGLLRPWAPAPTAPVYVASLTPPPCPLWQVLPWVQRDDASCGDKGLLPALPVLLLPCIPQRCSRPDPALPNLPVCSVHQERPRCVQA